MAPASVGNEVEVPARCFDVKPWFPERPNSAKVKEIADFIAMTGQPFMWPGHTHTRPAPGRVVYLDEFMLPERFRKAKRFCPCPCCSPRHGKFGEGRIAWFPDEAVIRLIGHKCFRSLDKDAHESAELELRQRKQREADIRYLLKHHDHMKRSHDVCVAAQPVAEAIQALAKQLQRTFEQRLDLPVWPYIKHGTLPVWEEFTEVTGDGRFETKSRQRSFGSIDGYRLLDPSIKSFGFRLEQVIAGFRIALQHDDWAAFVSSLSDEDRRKTAKVVARAVSTGREILGEMRELQQFTEYRSVSTFARWARHEGNAAPFVFERHDMTFRIGKNINAKMRVEIPAAFETRLGEIEVPLIEDLAKD